MILLPLRTAPLAEDYCSFSPRLETGGLLLIPWELPTLELELSIVIWAFTEVILAFCRLGDIKPVGTFLSFLDFGLGYFELLLLLLSSIFNFYNNL